MYIPRHNQGFTLVEMIVVIALFTILSLSVTSAIVQFYRTNAYAVAQSSEVQSASNALKLVVRDIREVTYADNGSFPIITASSNRFVFFSDVDRDGSVEMVEYVLVGTTLMKNITNAAGPPPTYPGVPSEVRTVSTFVRNAAQAVPTFRYFNSADQEVNGSDVTKIMSVSLEIIVNVDPNRSPGLFTLTSQATLRNLKNNL
jgi:prepilin-type N-terminal cleavage/methylation domain-containing protein